MKARNINWVSLFFICGFLLSSVGVNSQDIKLTAKEKKEARKAQMTEKYYVMDSLLTSRRFVLEADFLRDRYGYMVPVQSALNFISVNEIKGVLQTGSDYRLGYNGVGGVTAEGNIGGWKVNKNSKNLTFTISFNLLTSLGNFDIIMTISSDNNASATITGTTSGRLTWTGHLKSADISRVYKGQNTI
jgi:hypothetical protein